jgi:hypothetical protein
MIFTYTCLKRVEFAYLSVETLNHDLRSLGCPCLLDQRDLIHHVTHFFLDVLLVRFKCYKISSISNER